MGWITETRRRLIREQGRDMVLSRYGANNPVTVRAYGPPPQTASLTDEGLAIDPFIVQITDDETSAAGWTPIPRDSLTDGKRLYNLTDATPVYDKGVLCGWTLIAAGGE